MTTQEDKKEDVEKRVEKIPAVAARTESPKDKAPQRSGARYAKPMDDPQEEQFIEKVINIGRVSKVVKGGRRFSFSALVVVGDGDGRVGFALGKANEVADSIRKGSKGAKRYMIEVPRKGDTIPHEIIGEYGAARVLLKPASPGTGIIAGGPVRALCDACGIKDIRAKRLGSPNPGNVIKATINGFMNLSIKKDRLESEE